MAVRLYTDRADIGRRKRRTKERQKPPTWPRSVLVFDTETTIDAAQALLFGSYQFRRWRGGHFDCVEEGVFYADELTDEDPAGLATLRRYARRHKLRFLSRHE